MLYTTEGWEKENEATNDHLRPTYQINAAKAFGYLGYIFSALFLCLALFMRKRISLANGIIKEAARVIKRMPTLVVMPILSVIGIAVFFVPWLIYSVYTASLTSVSTYELGGLNLKEFEYEVVFYHYSLFSEKSQLGLISTSYNTLGRDNISRLVPPFLCLLVTRVHLCNGADSSGTMRSQVLLLQGQVQGRWFIHGF